MTSDVQTHGTLSGEWIRHGTRHDNMKHVTLVQNQIRHGTCHPGKGPLLAIRITALNRQHSRNRPSNFQTSTTTSNKQL